MANVPDDLYFTKDHEWVRLDADGATATVGVTDFAQHELGDIVYVTLPGPGETFEAEATFGSVEAVKTVSDLFMPVAGRIVEANGDLDANPQHVNEDPYGQGWMVKVELADPAALDGLMRADAYREMVG